jgi:Ca2+-binding EF-hand superfamily protein
MGGFSESSPSRNGGNSGSPGSNARGSPGGKGGSPKGKFGKGKGGDDDEEEDPEAREEARLRALMIDWKALAKALPTGGDDESIKKRTIIFEDWDVNSNGSLSYSEVDRAMKKLMTVLTPGLVGGKKGALFEWGRSWKPVIMRAFSHAKEFNSLRQGKGKRNNDYVERDEFRLLLVCIRQFFELFIAFSRMDLNVDRKIDKEEFVASLPELAKWGIFIAEADAMAEFEKVDTDGSGTIMFEEFICWALERNLDLEDDDEDHAAEYLEEMMKSAESQVFL